MKTSDTAAVLADAIGHRRLGRRQSRRLAADLRRILAALPPEPQPADAYLRADLAAAADELDALSPR